MMIDADRGVARWAKSLAVRRHTTEHGRQIDRIGGAPWRRKSVINRLIFKIAHQLAERLAQLILLLPGIGARGPCAIA